jgi:hypothetical protein
VKFPWNALGGAKRRSPTSGHAYGIPRNWDALVVGHLAPFTVPNWICAVGDVWASAWTMQKPLSR